MEKKLSDKKIILGAQEITEFDKETGEVKVSSKQFTILPDNADIQAIGTNTPGRVGQDLEEILISACRAISRSEEFGTTELRLIMLFLGSMNRDNITYCSLDSLNEYLGISKGTLSKSLKKLEDMNIIKRKWACRSKPIGGAMIITIDLESLIKMDKDYSK